VQTVQPHQPSVAQLFYDLGTGFSEYRSVRQGTAGDGSSQQCRFQIPSTSLRGLRFDPTESDAAVTLKDAELILGLNGRTVHRFATRDFIPEHQIESVVEVDGAIVITPEPGSTDRSAG